MDPSSTDMGMEVCSSVLVELFFSFPIVPTCDNRVAGFIAAFSAGLRAGFYFLHNCARAAAFIVTSRTCLCSYTGDKVPQDFWQDLPHHFSYFSRKSIQEGIHNRVWEISR